MKISGLQNLTLIDYPGKTACTLFLFGCNFRCGFCHNPELVLGSSELSKKNSFKLEQGAHPTHSLREEDSDEQKTQENNLQDPVQEYSQDEILDFLQKRKKYLDGVCFTGGEPLMTLEKDFLIKVKELGYKIKIDTNGSYPEKLQEFIGEGLVDYVAMDVKASKENYSKVVSADVDLNKIEKSIKMIAGLPAYEFRTTIVRKFHDVREMKELVSWVGELVGGKIRRFVLQGFKVEDKLVDESFRAEKNVDEEYLKEMKRAVEQGCEGVVVRV